MTRMAGQARRTSGLSFFLSRTRVWFDEHLFETSKDSGGMQVAGESRRASSLPVPFELLARHHRRLPVSTGLAHLRLRREHCRQGRQDKGEPHRLTVKSSTSLVFEEKWTRLLLEPGRESSGQSFQGQPGPEPKDPVWRLGRHGQVRDHDRRRRGNGNCSSTSSKHFFPFLCQHPLRKRRRAVIGRCPKRSLTPLSTHHHATISEPAHRVRKG